MSRRSRAPATMGLGRDAPAGEAPSAGGGTLYVVATPIGNLGDVTLRALEVLRAVALIACEDTRITRRLLDRHGIDGRLVSFHARSAPARLGELLGHLRSGLDLALTTDAGTPGVSDPGESLVAGWAGEGGRVVPIPGPSAVLAAVAGSGISGPRWTFEGFLPRAGRERRARLARIAADERGTIIFEAPNRLAATLAELASACGDARPAAVARELTKVHEQFARGRLAELAAMASEGAIPARGEAVIVIGATRPGEPGTVEARAGDLADGSRPGERLAAARADVARRIAAGTGRADAARQVAAETGISRRHLYRPDPAG